MRRNQPQELVDILGKAEGLLQLQERVTILAELEKIINNVLPPELNKYWRIANYRQNILVIQVSSASWLSRLRYEQSNLLSELRKKMLPSLSSIQYQIAPDMATTYRSSTTLSSNNDDLFRSMTKESAFFISNLAEHAPKQLKKKLIKLASHAK